MTQTKRKQKSLHGLNLEAELLHDEVGQEFLAGRFHFRLGFGGIGGFQPDVDVLADADVVHLVDSEVVKAELDGLALRVEDFFNGHNVDVGDELHGEA